MGAGLTTLSVDRKTAEQIRLARIDMSAELRREMSTSEVLARLLEMWRQMRGVSEEAAV